MTDGIKPGRKKMGKKLGKKEDRYIYWRDVYQQIERERERERE